ncbi:MAG: hypothetical protein HZC55_00100 [Verrucomicrobia bacterium]|nr:hypothetical protein [Verrucomicrobiota bacterium]
MSPIPRALVVGCLAAALPVFAVYAPVPDQDQVQGKDLNITLKAGLANDSNIFGAASSEIDSTIWTVAPRGSYSASLTDQTFLSVSYGLTVDQFEDRPGDKLLDSHDASLRLAHAFSKTTTIDINDSFMVARNPESLLAGVKLNTDQSFLRNQIDGRFITPLGAKATGTIKARSIYYEYRDAALGRSLDRIENLYGASADYAVLPEVKAVAEFRHQDVFYTKLGETKNKSSDYLMAGADYEVARKLSLSGRVGAEWRSREAERSTTSPYVEFSAKYDYTEKSYLLGGFAYTLEETSDTARFNDTKVYRTFVSVMHYVGAFTVASASLTYEPSTLQGRRTQVNVDETTVRGGVALSYLPTKNWTLSASYDHDRVRSDDVQRKLKRNRFGLSAVYTF